MLAFLSIPEILGAIATSQETFLLYLANARGCNQNMQGSEYFALKTFQHPPTPQPLKNAALL